jgi:serine/threonine-protein kinase
VRDPRGAVLEPPRAVGGFPSCVPGRTLATAADAAERDEHVALVLRLRRACTVAVFAWPLFGALDWFVASQGEPGRLWYFLLLRAIGLVAIGLAVLVFFAPRMPGPGVVRWTEPLVSILLAVLISLGAIEDRGIDSPLATGVLVLLLGRGALLAQPWRGALPKAGAIALAYPATLAACALGSPELAAEFAVPAERGGFVVSAGFLLGGAAISIYAGHTMWALRRQVFQTRALGRYRLKHLIGKGGMGEVWAAHHHALGRDVAIKILRGDDRAAPNAIARFEREVRATAELCHPNTIRVFDFGVTEDGLCYYAMELLSGQDLADWVADRGPVRPELAAHLCLQAARALGEAHARGIIHRDVKPENLFLARIGDEEMIKVLDFGLAAGHARELGPELTETGYAVGTPRWAPPEVAFGRLADARSDVYALGAVLYFLVTGTPPYQTRDVGALLAAHLDEAIEPPSARLGRRLPAALEAVILRCLEKDPARRYADAGALAAVLEAAFPGLDRPPGALAGTARAAERRAPEPRVATGSGPRLPPTTRPAPELAASQGPASQRPASQRPAPSLPAPRIPRRPPPPRRRMG